MQFGSGDGMNKCGLAVSQSICARPVNNYQEEKKPEVIGL